MSKLIQVIETISKRGKGVPSDPVRIVTEYWSTDGTLLAEADDQKPKSQKPKKRFEIELREHPNKTLTGQQLTINGYICGMVDMDADTRRRLIEQIEVFNEDS